MAGSADASPLLALLHEATTQGRPALALTRRRAAEVLGMAPDDRWWAEHADAWLGVGWRAQLTPDVVTFLPADQEPAGPVEVRIAVTWPRPDGPPGRVTVDGRELPLSDPDVLKIVRLAARMRAADRDGAGGGSGI